MTGAVADVVVGARFRTDYGDMDDLMASISALGVLSPITLTEGNRLLCGGRRLEACKRLGLDAIPFHYVATQADALTALRAERDENVCRKPMTASELVALGQEIERMERPKAAERQGRPGLPKGAPAPFASREENGARPRTNTNAVVADALGLGETTYYRMKGVVQIADGTIPTAPGVQEVARKELRDLDAGTSSAGRAYSKIRDAMKPKPEPGPANLAMLQPPKYGARRKHLQMLNAMEASLAGLSLAASEIQALDGTVTKEEAARLADDLSNHIRSLNRIKQLLKERTE